MTIKPKKKSISEQTIPEHPTETSVTLERKPSVVEEIHQEIKITKKKKSIPTKPDDVAQAVTIKKKKKSVQEESVTLTSPLVSGEGAVQEESVSLKTPLVTEEGLIRMGDEQVESEIESSFKLKPSKRKSVTEESITLEQPTSVTLQQEQLLTEDRVQEELAQEVGWLRGFYYKAYSGFLVVVWDPNPEFANFGSP